MLKTEAIQLLGGSIAYAAEAIGVSYQAVDKWPEVLSPRVADRVHAALWRKAHDAQVKRFGTDVANTAQEPSEAPASAGDPYLPAQDETVKRLERATTPLKRRSSDRDGPGARDERHRTRHAGAGNREIHPR